MFTNKKKILRQEYLTFVIDDKIYAFPVLCLQCVLGNPDTTLLNAAPKFAVGVSHLKNYNIPVLDLRTILNKPDKLVLNKICIVIVRVSFKKEEKLVGFIVDSVFTICKVDKNAIVKLPFYEDEKFISAIIQKKDKIGLILDPEKIINDDNVILFLNQFWEGYYSNNNTNSYRRNKNGV